MSRSTGTPNRGRRRRPAAAQAIRLRGVRVHNLRGVDVDIPRGRLTVVTGVSGSGKSSLAFDTLYAEGRRRYVECLSTYTQQFLDRMARPDLDEADGLPPAVALERAVPATQARSTVGTTTEIHDSLRLLFARIGRTFCVDCGGEVRDEPPTLVATELAREGGRALVAFEADSPRSKAGRGRLLDELRRDGFVRLWIDGVAVGLDDAKLPAGGTVEVVVDRLDLGAAPRTRIAEAIETAYRFGHRRCIVRWADGRSRRWSAALHCPACDREYRRPEPRLFSPNSPLGACAACQGFGRIIGPDLDRIVPDRGLSLNEGAIEPWNTPRNRKAYHDLRAPGREIGLDWKTPYGDLPAEHRRLIEDGGKRFYGIAGFFKRLERKTYRMHVRVFLARYRAYRRCAACAGRRLGPDALAVRVGDVTIADACELPVAELAAWVHGLDLAGTRAGIAAPIVAELERRLRFMIEVGLGYLTLDRPSRTLSGGEAQRIQLARAVGSALTDTLYVLDEPSVGLHPLDVERLIGVLGRLRDLGNTVVVVEHDPRIMACADHVIDLGPGAGEHGGTVLYQGAPAGLTETPGSATAEFLSGRRSVAPALLTRTPGRAGWLVLEGAATHNLREVTVRFPREALTVVTGVSGSGKSSLIHDTLHGAVARAVGGGTRIDVGPYRTLRGADELDGVELVDQAPIGRSPRSNPVTYVKAFDGIRKRLASTPAARARGLKPGWFSFNVPGGRCESCQGAGAVLVEMHFLPDMLVPCAECDGTRYSREARRIRDHGRHVAEILALTVDDALEAYPDGEVASRLRVLKDVGLGYLRLGQPAPTLSGGEAQRLKLAAHLRDRGGERRLFLLDEPTTGLHLADVAVLADLLRRLVDRGHTVIVVEHHLDLIRAADWVVDLGPGPGADGGTVVAAGTPADVARSSGPTGHHLAASLTHRKRGRSPSSRKRGPSPFPA